jgi:hypothetical protein
LAFLAPFLLAFFPTAFLIGLLFLAAFGFLTFGALTFGAFVFLAGDLAGEEAATGAGTEAATTGATFAGFATFALGFVEALVVFAFDAGFLDTDLFCAFAIFLLLYEKISNFYNL